MYSIFIRNMTVVNSEELCIYSDETVEDKFKVESASLKLQEGNAGSLTLKMPPINVGYNEIETLATQVIVRKDGAVYWFGRVIEVKIDYNNNKEVLCEGAFNYLMDTIQPPYHASSSISSWITHLIETHNTTVVAANEPWKQVVVGYIDPNINPSTNTDLYTNYETTLDMIGNACEGWEAHPLFTYQVDSMTKFPKLVLNFYKTYYLDGDGIPEIIFGENLSDYTKEIKNEDVATVVIPLGKEYTDEEKVAIQKEWTDHPSDPTAWTEPKPATDITDLDWRRTVYSVNNQSVYLYDTQANLNRYGYNCKTVEFSETIDYAELKAAGEKYLRDQKWDKLTLTLSGYDLSLLDYNRSPIKMGGLVHCLSKPHGLDYNYPCTAIEEDLLDATATTYTLGTADNKYITDSSRQTDQKLRDAVTQAVAREKVIQQNSYNYTDGSVTDIYNELEEEIQAITFDPSEAVEEAKTNALQLLNIYDEEKNPERKGYVHFVKETADYNAGDELSIDDLKTRINKYFSANAQVQQFLTRIDTCLAATETYKETGNGRYYVIYALLGPNDSQSAVTIIEYTTTGPNCYQWLNSNTGWVNGSQFSNYTGNVDSFFVSSSSSKYGVQASYAGDRVNSGTKKTYNWAEVDSNLRTDGYVSSYSRNQVVFGASAYNFNVPDSQTYITDAVYRTASSTAEELYPISLKAEVITNPQDHITEIVISDKADYMTNDANLWRWNKEGLYYLNGGYNSNTLTPNTEAHEGYQSVDERLRLALTKDGSIVADRITAGKLDAGIIRAGVIQSQNDNGSALQIAMDTGTILAKKARIVFANARDHSGTPDNPDQPLNEFAYFSNEPINRYMNISGQLSKDWMLAVGSSFGVDKFGRVYMREGHIGGVGGVFDIKAYNDAPVAPPYGVQPGTAGNTIAYDISISSDSYRPAVDPDSILEQQKFFFRLGYYSDGTTITCISGINGFVFEAGTSPEVYEFDIPIVEDNTLPYYPGQLFPVWYVTAGDGESYDYEEDGVHYRQMTGVLDSYVVEITGYYDSDQETPTMPQYKSWTNERYGAPTTSQGTIHIGTGYLDNGNIGENRSFYLGGITRSGSVAGYSKSNWRFTVGSRFGVDEDGRMYCTGAFLDDIQARGSVVAYSANFNSITNMNLRASTSLDTQPQYVRLKWRLHNTGSYTTEGDTGIFTTKTAFSVLVDQGDPASYRPASDMSYSPNLTFKVSEVVIDSVHGTPLDPIPRGTFSFSYNKLGTDPQVIIIDTSTWDDVPQGSPMSPTGEIDIEVEMSNENTSTMVLHSATQFKHWPTEGGATDTMYYGEGYMIFKNVTGYERPAVHVSAEYFTGSKLGGPNERWQEGWINSLTYTSPPSGSSSKLYKHDIEGLDARYDKLLDILRPVRFRFNKDHYDDGGLYHAGFILEELKENMDIAGIKPEEFGAYDPNPNGGGGIRYSEFIPLIVDQLQKLKRENEDLKRQLYEKGILDD